MQALFPQADLAACFLLVRRRFGADLKECELKVWEFILDKTLGFDKAADILSLSQCIEGTGCSLNSVLNGLRGLESRSILFQEMLGQQRLILLSTPENVSLLSRYRAGVLSSTELKILSRQRLSTSSEFEEGGGAATSNFEEAKHSATSDFEEALNQTSSKSEDLQNLKRPEPEFDVPTSSKSEPPSKFEEVSKVVPNHSAMQSLGQMLSDQETSSKFEPLQILKTQIRSDLDQISKDRSDQDPDQDQEIKNSGEAAREIGQVLTDPIPPQVPDSPPGGNVTSSPCLIPDPTDLWFDLPASARPPRGFTDEQWQQYCANRKQMALIKDPETEFAKLQKRQANQKQRLSDAQLKQLQALQAQPLVDLVRGFYDQYITNPKDRERDLANLPPFIRELQTLVDTNQRVLLLIEPAFARTQGSAWSLKPVQINLSNEARKIGVDCPEHWAGKKKSAA